MQRKHPFTPEEFREIYSKVPRVSVDLVIQTPKGIVLTLRSLSSWNNLWHFPGSTILYRESAEDTVRRTALEEAGISVNVKECLGYIEYPSEQKQRGFGSTISLVFLCEITGGTLAPNNEAEKIGVFPSLAALPPNIIEEHRPLLKRFLPENIRNF